MAKKTKALKPDDDGYLRTGIYRTRKEPMTEENAKEYCDAINQTAADRLANIKSELVEFVLRYLEGPYSQEQRGDLPGTMQVVDRGDGNEVYRELPIVKEESGEPHIHQYHHAIDALREIHILIEPNLHGGNQDLLFRATLKLGMLLERMAVRPFEPNALVGRKVTECSSASGKLNAALTLSQKVEVSTKVSESILQGNSQNSACETIATEYKVSQSVIARAYRESKNK